MANWHYKNNQTQYFKKILQLIKTRKQHKNVRKKIVIQYKKYIDNYRMVYCTDILRQF